MFKQRSFHLPLPQPLFLIPSHLDLPAPFLPNIHSSPPFLHPFRFTIPEPCFTCPLPEYLFLLPSHLDLPVLFLPYTHSPAPIPPPVPLHYSRVLIHLSTCSGCPVTCIHLSLSFTLVHTLPCPAPLLPGPETPVPFLRPFLLLSSLVPYLVLIHLPLPEPLLRGLTWSISVLPVSSFISYLSMLCYS